MTAFETAFAARQDLQKFGNNALLLFALQLQFQMEDIGSVATDALTDGPNDKKADLVFVDDERGVAIIAQGYFAQSAAQSAPANKASDLNTAAAWLLSRPVAELPIGLRPAATALRDAIQAKKIQSLQLWYVHNCPESTNVATELKTVELTARNASGPDSGITEISAREVGLKTLEEWYQAVTTPILVTDSLLVPVPGGYQQDGKDWSAFVTSVPAPWLYEVFKKHGSSLFSANIRGYLGSTRGDANINHGIKESAEGEPGRFWVFNNGLTILVHQFKYNQAASTLEITGISIVNGAQTTGAIGSLAAKPAADAMVPARFVRCEATETIKNIIQYNNRQNRVEASDFRSNDVVQRRLREEFKTFPNLTYSGGRRGGHDDIIRRPANLLPSDAAAQALAAVHQEPGTAYHAKSAIWESNHLYARYFNEQTSARHVIFCYSLLRAIEEVKVLLVEKGKTTEPTQHDRDHLDFLRNRGSSHLLVAAISACLEIFSGRAVTNRFSLSFGDVPLAEAQKAWAPVVEATMAFCTQLQPALQNGLRKDDETRRSIANFVTMVIATKGANAQLYSAFSAKLKIA